MGVWCGSMSYAAGIRGSRGNTRGGADQFSWEDVKADANRQRYLGNSLHAPVGRWQEKKDLMWWNKKKNANTGHSGNRGANSGTMQAEQERQLELDTVRYREETIRCEALGLPPPTKPQSMILAEKRDADADTTKSTPQNCLTEVERVALLKRQPVPGPDRISDAGDRFAASSRAPLAKSLDNKSKRRASTDTNELASRDAKKARKEKHKKNLKKKKKKKKKGKKKKPARDESKSKKKNKSKSKKKNVSEPSSGSSSDSSSSSNDDDKLLLMARQFLEAQGQ